MVLLYTVYIGLWHIVFMCVKIYKYNVGPC